MRGSDTSTPCADGHLPARRDLLFVFQIVAMLLAGCAREAAEPDPQIGIRISWLDPTRPAQSIPREIARLEIAAYDLPPPHTLSRTVAVSDLEDANGDGHPEIALPDLPTNARFSLKIRGFDSAGRARYVGHSGPITLASGERRYVHLRMFPVGEWNSLDGPDVPAGFLQTATELLDGRVLVTGGFVTTLEANCPPGVPAFSLCFDAEAVNDAYVFDPTSGTFYSVRRGMLAPRAGHTATRMPDGRVLIAGGVSRGALVFTRDIGTGAPSYSVSFSDRGSRDTTSRAHASFEIFDPVLNRGQDDPGRSDGLDRGGFIGSDVRPSILGAMNLARAFHSAAIVPDEPNRVLLVGGLGNAGTSFEVYDHRKAGGNGFYNAADNYARVPRTQPALISTGYGTNGKTWIVGGAAASANTMIADVWSSPRTGLPNGTIRAATEVGFLGPPGTTAPPAPLYGLVGAVGAPIGGGEYALVIGWMGPRCIRNTNFAVFPISSFSYELCGPDSVPPRNFLIEGATGAVTPVPTFFQHGFGAAVSLEDGAVVVTGGFANRALEPCVGTTIFSGRVLGGAAEGGGQGPYLNAGRAFHASASLRDRGALIIGGIQVIGDRITDIRIVPTAETIYLAP